MTVARDAIAIPDSTGPTLSLLRELRRGHAKKQAASVAYWAYLVAILACVYGGSAIAAAVRALRHPPAVTTQTPHVLQAAPAGLAALALIAGVLLLRDALWRGPVTLPQAAVDWLLGTPVDRAALLRPRFRRSAALAVLAGAAVGIVPAAALVALGLGAGNTGASDVLRLTGASSLSTALLFALATGVAGLVERYPASWPWLRRATPVALAAAALFAGLAAWTMLGRPPAVLADIALWSGPWGWAGQATVAAAGGAAPLWLLATGALALLALAALTCAYRAAAGVAGPVLRIRAATLGAMSAAALNMDTRSVAAAYSAAGTSRRARFRLRPPRQRQLILFWRDLLALSRAPSRLVGAAALTLLAVGLVAVARRGGHDPLVPVACAMALGYLAAAWLCEGARLDADDTRRSVALPFRFASLAWWHAAIPCLILLVVAGVPATALCLAAGEPRLLLLLVAVPVLITGAMVNVFRGQYPPDLFSGVDTPVGNTAAVRIVFWYAWGPILAVAPTAVLVSSAIGSPDPGALARAVVIGAGLAAALGAYAARRAARLRAG